MSLFTKSRKESFLREFAMSAFNPFMTEAVITDWFLYDNGLRHERVKENVVSLSQTQEYQILLG